MLPQKQYNPIDLQPNIAVGIKLPIVRRDGRLFEQSYTTEDQAISNLKNLILTREGERLMHPLLGTKLQDALFEPNSDVMAERIRNSIQRAVGYWLPYISITSLNVQAVIATGSDREEHGITISLVVALNNQEANIPITFLVTPSTIAVI